MSSFNDYKQEWCKRRVPSQHDMPAVWYVPDQTIGRETVRFTIYDDNGKKDMEYKIQLYDGQGRPEDLLRWWLTVEKYFALKKIDENDVEDKYKQTKYRVKCILFTTCIVTCYIETSERNSYLPVYM